MSRIPINIDGRFHQLFRGCAAASIAGASVNDRVKARLKLAIREHEKHLHFGEPGIAEALLISAARAFVFVGPREAGTAEALDGAMKVASGHFGSQADDAPPNWYQQGQYG